MKGETLAEVLPAPTELQCRRLLALLSAARPATDEHDKLSAPRGDRDVAS